MSGARSASRSDSRMSAAARLAALPGSSLAIAATPAIRVSGGSFASAIASTRDVLPIVARALIAMSRVSASVAGSRARSASFAAASSRFQSPASRMADLRVAESSLDASMRSTTRERSPSGLIPLRVRAASASASSASARSFGGNPPGSVARSRRKPRSAGVPSWAILAMICGWRSSGTRPLFKSRTRALSVLGGSSGAGFAARITKASAVSIRDVLARVPGSCARQLRR